MGLYENVKRACKEEGMTVSALEKELNIAKGSISKWDKNTPSIKRVEAVANTLHKPIDYFLQ